MRKTPTLELLLEFVVVNVVLVLSSNEYHQVIVTILAISVYHVEDIATMLTDKRVFLQDPCGPLFDSELVLAAKSPDREGWSNGSEHESSNEEEEHGNDCVIGPF